MPVVREDNFICMLEKFWRCSLNEIITPAPMNMFALNIACVSRWKKHRFAIPILSVVIIRPNCLMVDRAMVSFKSFFVMAHAAGMHMVIDPVIIRVVLKNENSERNLWNRIRIYTPAVTNVDEWTRADTGVGAAIAQVSHALNGIWALLVIAASRIRAVVADGLVIVFLHMFMECQ